MPFNRLCAVPPILIVGLLAHASHGATGTVSPEDVSARFVEQLRAEGHGDLVGDFLERAIESPLVSEDFKRQIPVQLLANRIEQAQADRDLAARVAALEALKPQVESLGASGVAARRLAVDFADRWGVASAELARRDALAAEQVASAADRAEARRAARAEIDSARARLVEAEKLASRELESLKGVQPESPAGRRRADLSARLGLLRLLEARLVHEQALTYPEGDGDRTRLNREAAEKLGALYSKYSKRVVGLYAHLYEGRCYRLLGDRQRALAALEDLTSQPAPSTELRRVVTLAHAEVAALAVDQGDAAGALGKPAKWLEELDASELEGPEAATLRYRLGLAMLAQREDAPKADQRRLQREARELLQAAARVPSEVQGDARERWAQLSAELGLDAEDPKTFEEAQAAAAEALQTMTTLEQALADADEAARSTLEQQRRQAADAAYRTVEAALRLARDKKPDPEDLARAKYQLAWLDWDRGDVAKAASRAQFVARQDAATESGEPAAKLALAALERAKRDGAPGAAEELRSFAEFVVATWPEGEAAAAALSVVVGDLLVAGKLDEAQRFASAAPESQRDALALRVAAARWEKTRSDPAASAASLAALQEAYEVAAGSGNGSATPMLATAALYLADAALDAGDAAKAKRLLEEPSHGPSVLVSRQSSPGDTAAFALATLKSVIRLAAVSDESAKPAIERYAKAIASLPAEATGGDRSWLAVAVSLAADLDRSGGPRERLAEALVEVLDRAKSLAETGDWNTRLWIAQSRLRCGAALEGERAKSNLTASRDAFASLVAAAEATPGFAPTPAALLAAKLRLAECDRELGDYAAAIEGVAGLLSKSAALLEAQRFAAETLSRWGVAERSAQRLEEAIAGARPGEDGKNLLWGWSKLAAVAGRYAASDPGRQRLYFDAWREVASARYEAALLADGASRGEQLRKAAGTLAAVERKNPGLGGEENQRAYASLRKRIQRALDGSPNALTPSGT